MLAKAGTTAFIDTEVARDRVHPCREFGGASVSLLRSDHPQQNLLQQFFGPSGIVHAPQEDVIEASSMASDEDLEGVRLPQAKRVHQCFVVPRIAGFSAPRARNTRQTVIQETLGSHRVRTPAERTTVGADLHLPNTRQKSVIGTSDF
jgi:hypothetical protein